MTSAIPPPLSSAASTARATRRRALARRRRTPAADAGRAAVGDPNTRSRRRRHRLTLTSFAGCRIATKIGAEADVESLHPAKRITVDGIFFVLSFFLFLIIDVTCESLLGFLPYL